MTDDSTIVLTDIKAALASSDEEAKEKPAALVVVGGDLNGTIFDLDKESTTLGRSIENTISLEFQGISRHHMKVTLAGKDVLLEDTGSKNAFKPSQIAMSGEATNKTRSPSKKSYEIYVNDFET